MFPIRYGYQGVLQPPAPFVNVTLRNLPGTQELTGHPAQVDTGADRTVLPLSTVEALGLIPVDQILIAGIGAVRRALSTFAVYLTLHDLPTVLVEVLGVAEEPWILLGRDVLNAHRLLLNGPQLALEIDRP